MTKPRKRANAARPKGRQPCIFPGCVKPNFAHGLCNSHRRQLHLGIELRPVRPPRPTAEPGFHWCSTCKLFHAEEDFSWDKTRGQFQRVCRDCATASQRRHNAANAERINLVRRLKKRGITEDQYEVMVREQKGACAICGRTDRKLDIDHCHTSGRVRALLCGPCNRAIGFMNDDTDLLLSAITYLESHKQQ